MWVVKFHSHWQPLPNENAHTAMVFGFLRHAPTSLALDPWLTNTLDRPAAGRPLDTSSFWRPFASSEDGRVYTEPDVVIQADDGNPLLVIVEVKPAYGQHTYEQLEREAVDAARAENSARITVVLVGADLAAPPELPEWEAHARDTLAACDMAEVDVEFRYSSWASLARVIDDAAVTDDTWRRYADDVLFKLRVKGVLDYDGAPMIDDLQGLTLTHAVEVVHRIMRAFRLLALAVHSQSDLTELDLVPYGGHALLRDGRSTGLPGNPGSFETSVLLVPYSSALWPDGCGVFFSAFLVAEDGPHLEVGAFQIDAGRGELPWQFAQADPVEQLESAGLESAHGKTLDQRAASKYAEWVYAERKWTPGAGDADIAWVIEGLRAATRACDGSCGKPPTIPEIDLSQLYRPPSPG